MLKPRPPKRVLALPGLEQTIATVLHNLTSKSGRRRYRRSAQQGPTACFALGRSHWPCWQDRVHS